MQYLVQTHSPIAAAVKHALTGVLAIPATDVVEKDAFGVVVSGTTYHGLLPVLRALRAGAATATAAHKAFLGAESADQTALVNQWVSAASLLSADAVQSAAYPETYTSVAPALYADIERALETSSLRHAFLAGTTRATIADVLLYAALHAHPLHAQVRPTTLLWSVHAQADAYLEFVRVSHVQAAKATTQRGGGGGASEASVYVKPTEEEIARRRVEKEKAKKEKEAAKAAAAGGSGGAGAAAPASAKQGKKTEELDVRQLELRVGRLSNLRRHPEADRLYVEDMDLGTETRTIVSGLVESYTLEELNDTLCFVVCNMKAKPLKGVTSQGMVLCACSDTSLRLLRPPAGAQPGDRLVFGPAFVKAESEAPSPAQLSGTKMTELLAHLRTNDAGVLCWKDLPAQHALGTVSVPEMPNCIVK